MHEKEFTSVRDFLPQVPEQITLTTGADEIGQIEEIRNRFFEDILDYLGITRNARRAFCDVRAHALSVDDYEKISFAGSDGKMQARLEYVSILMVGDYAAASCLQLRDDGNQNQASFAHYLTPETEKRIRKRMYNSSTKDILYIGDPRRS